MRILLLNPPAKGKKEFIREGRCTQEKGAWTTLWPPVTLATIGALLEAKGHEVEIIDAAAQAVSFGALQEKFKRTKYDLVVWSSATPSISNDLDLAEQIHTQSPESRTAVLGTHVSALAELCLESSPTLGFVVRNEPEETVVALAHALQDGRGAADVPGISYRDGSKLLHNPSRHFIQDLDRLPFPAWHHLDLGKYRLPLIGKRFLILSPLRGCPYPCSFCTARTYYGKKIRRRSIPNLMAEIEYDLKQFGVDHFLVWADTFTAERDYVIDFCRTVREKGLRISWTCNSRVDTLDKPLLRAMADAGCWMISMGIESGSQSVLDQSNKGITLDQSRSAVRMAKSTGLRVAAHFILGLPGDTRETLDDTIDFALKLDLDLAQFYCATPFPGSPLYELAKREGWIEGVEFEAFNQDHAVMSFPALQPSTVNRYRSTAFRRFYIRPKIILRLLQMAQARGAWEMLAGGGRFLKWIAT